MPIIMGQVLNESTVYTNNWKSYDGLVLDGYKHFRIHHHENQFARDKNHVNGIEPTEGGTLAAGSPKGERSEAILLEFH